jgi:hypothetical protein
MKNFFYTQKKEKGAVLLIAFLFLLGAFFSLPGILKASGGSPEFTLGAVVSLDEANYEEVIYVEDKQKLFYKVVVINRGDVAGDVTIQAQIFPPSNGGAVNIVPGSERNTCQNYTDSCTGSIFTELSVKKLQPGKSIVVYYEAISDTDGVVGGESGVVTRYSISDGQVDWVDVVLKPDTGTANLDIGNVVSTDGVNYSKNVHIKDGDTVYFKLVVINRGSAPEDFTLFNDFDFSDGGSVTIPHPTDTCSSYVDSCEGDIFGLLTVKQLQPGKSFVIYYEAKVEIHGDKDWGIVRNILNLSDRDESASNVFISEE